MCVIFVRYSNLILFSLQDCKILITFRHILFLCISPWLSIIYLSIYVSSTSVYVYNIWLFNFSIYGSIFPSIYLYLSIFPSRYLYIRLHPAVYPSIPPSRYLSSVPPPSYRSIYLSIYLSICLYIYLNM